jgi:hypothetical protein
MVDMGDDGDIPYFLHESCFTDTKTQMKGKGNA